MTVDPEKKKLVDKIISQSVKCEDGKHWVVAVDFSPADTMDSTTVANIALTLMLIPVGRYEEFRSWYEAHGCYDTIVGCAVHAIPNWWFNHDSVLLSALVAEVEMVRDDFSFVYYSTKVKSKDRPDTSIPGLYGNSEEEVRKTLSAVSVEQLECLCRLQQSLHEALSKYALETLFVTACISMFNGGFLKREIH